MHRRIARSRDELLWRPMPPGDPQSGAGTAQRGRGSGAGRSAKCETRAKLPMFGQFEQFGYGILMEFHGFWVIQLRNQFMRTL